MAGVELLASLEPDQLTLSGILGTGAYAVVYRGSLRLMTDRGESLVRCAVKVLQPDAGIVGGKEAIRMFAEEAKILRECSHR